MKKDIMVVRTLLFSTSNSSCILRKAFTDLVLLTLGICTLNFCQNKGHVDMWKALTDQSVYIWELYDHSVFA